MIGSPRSSVPIMIEKGHAWLYALGLSCGLDEAYGTVRVEVFDELSPAFHRGRAAAWRAVGRVRRRAQDRS